MVETHVTTCSRCRAMIEDLDAFFAPGEEAGAEETAAAWNSFRRRLDESPARTSRAVRFPITRGEWASLAAAAAVLIVVTSLLTAFLVAQRARSEMDVVKRKLDEAVRELAGLRGRTDIMPPLPHVNAAVLDLYPRHAIARGDTAAEGEVTAAVPSDAAATLILHAAPTDPRASYSLAIAAAADRRVIWHSPRLQPKDGAFVVTVPAAFLSPGRYRIRVFDKQPVLMNNTLAEGGIADYLLNWSHTW